jgi:DNA-binding MarR family transcriptional regulator
VTTAGQTVSPLTAASQAGPSAGTVAPTAATAPPTPPRELGADNFLVAFEALAQAVRRARGAAVQTGDQDLTLSQYALLRPLATRDRAQVRELALVAGVAAPTATRILDGLERRELVTRTRSAEDRRAVNVSLTAAGNDALTRQTRWMRGRQRAFYSTLPDVERELAPDLLLRLAGLIDELASGPE